MNRPLKYALLALLTLAVWACGSNNSTQRAVPRRYDIISGAELDATREGNVYDALLVARPSMLLPRGPADSILVFWNLNRLGGVATLQTFSLGGIVSVRRLNAADATFLFGPRATNTTTIQILTLP